MSWVCNGGCGTSIQEIDARLIMDHYTNCLHLPAEQRLKMREQLAKTKDGTLLEFTEVMKDAASKGEKIVWACKSGEWQWFLLKEKM
jgi:hypothetical protein